MRTQPQKGESKQSHMHAQSYSRFKILFVTYTIIQSITSSEMLVLVCYVVLRYGHIREFSAKYCGQKRSIVNSIAIYEAKLTQKSLSNQEAFCWNNCDQLEPKLLWGNHSTLHKIPTWIPIKMTKICLQKFTSNDKCDHIFMPLHAYNKGFIQTPLRCLLPEDLTMIKPFFYSIPICMQ